MTLEHTEFQALAEQLMDIIERHQDNPEALEAISQELNRMYKKIPIYAGIIEMVLPQTVSPAEIEELESGARVVASLKDGTKISGVVEEKESGKLVLTDCTKFEPVEEFDGTELAEDEISELDEIKVELLAEKWPSLDFEVDE